MGPVVNLRRSQRFSAARRESAPEPYLNPTSALSRRRRSHTLIRITVPLSESRLSWPFGVSAAVGEDPGCRILIGASFIGPWLKFSACVKCFTLDRRTAYQCSAVHHPPGR